MNVLLVNDDGIESPGIRILASVLKEEHNVYIVAPDSERSAASHSYSFNKPLTLNKYDKEGFSGCTAYITNGSPCDCVLLAIGEIGKEKIDLIIAGINAGANLGTDIPASATVNAALEGTIQGIPSIAVSQEIKSLVSFDDYYCYFSYAAEFIRDLVAKNDLSRFKDYIISINFPLISSSEIKGIKVCPMGKSQNDYFYHAQDDFLGRTYYWVDVKRTRKKYNDIYETDAKWLEDGYITVTPMSIDLTLYSKFDEVNSIFSEGVAKW